MRGLFVVRGRAWVALDAVASCYEVELAFLVEAHELGLLECERVEGSLAVAAELLDRVAWLLRLHRQQGLDPSAIALLSDALG